MRPLNFWERFYFSLLEMKQYFCKHKIIELVCKYGELYRGYGDYVGFCSKCGRQFRIIIKE